MAHATRKDLTRLGWRYAFSWLGRDAGLGSYATMARTRVEESIRGSDPQSQGELATRVQLDRSASKAVVR
jgi:hypothetical protein